MRCSNVIIESNSKSNWLDMLLDVNCMVLIILNLIIFHICGFIIHLFNTTTCTPLVLSSRICGFFFYKIVLVDILLGFVDQYVFFLFFLICMILWFTKLKVSILS